MSTHSVAEAKNKLPELIDRALSGEAVVITRHGHPVVELRPVPKQPRPLTQEDVDWLIANRVPTRGHVDGVALVSEMRDEDDERLFRR